MSQTLAMKSRLLIVTLSLALLGTVSGKEPERIKAAGGQTVIKGFYDDGTVKTITRLNPNGSLLGILYNTPKGVPTHADYYDDNKKVRRRVFYREAGTPKSAKEFDGHGKVVLEQEHDRAGNIIKSTVPK